jgi:septum formation topological specificity factor MinE
VGILDFFRRRRQRESAIPESGSELSPATPADQPVVGQQFSGQPAGGIDASGGFDVSSLSGLAGFAEAMKQAAAQGDAEVTQSSQTLDLRGTGLREEIVEIMKRHGIDPDSGSVQSAQINAASMPAMQAEMLEALKRHGIDSSGASIHIDGSEPQQPGQ